MWPEKKNSCLESSLSDKPPQYTEYKKSNTCVHSPSARRAGHCAESGGHDLET